MAFDLEGTLRRLKPEKRSGPLSRRKDASLPFVTEHTPATPLLLDTTVYIDQLTDRLPGVVSRLLEKSTVNHSSVAMAELAHPFGRLDPGHPKTAETLDAIRAAFALIPAHRVGTPSAQAAVEAGIVTGIIARQTGISKEDRQPMLNDATLLLQSLETGSVMLTRNISDLHLIQQIVPAGRVLFYRAI